PGETEEDFEATMDVVRRARFASAFTFQYSPRPGTPAAEMDNQIPKEIVQERFERLVALQDSIQAEENATLVGTDVELLVQAEG
ncbi:tRNA (N6-isopentenyl adenosine(37)-C2)-methylthiotransferase MiaB, partial [Escherichia coli]|nr:tRNA (N6-isopentenyl adenosine(37)-C2)-methylthiotransferase MiaB [Escherichia coli]